MKFLKPVKFVPLAGCAAIIMITYPRKSDTIRNNHLNSKDSIFASYRYRSPDSLAGTTITLKRDKTFSYSSGTDLQQVFSSGHWRMTKDTLFLINFINREDIPFTIKETETSIKDSLTIEWVKNLQGDIVKDAIVFINGDTTKSFMPAFSECTFAIGSVKKIKLAFNNKCTTKWHELTNESANKIEPIVNIDFPFNSYAFLAPQRYLVKKNGLYELNETVEKNSGRQTKTLIRGSIFYKKIKSTQR